MDGRKKKHLAACGGLVLLLAAGCAAPKPGQLPVTPRDREIYTDQGAMAQQKETKFRVSIVVRGDKTDEDGRISEALDSALVSAIGDFAFFTIVERSNLDVLAKEQQLEELSGDGNGSFEIPKADYLIAARPNAISIEEKETQGVTYLQGGRIEPKTVAEASMSVDFRFYEKATKRLILSKNIDKSLTASTAAEAEKKLAETAQECAKGFAQELGARYAPPARVVELRGGGRMARVTMGSNYGLVPGVRVEFFEYVDHSDLIEGATREPSPVGYGIVRESELNTAWAEVLDWESSYVKRGHYVKIAADQSKGFRESVRGLLP